MSTRYCFNVVQASASSSSIRRLNWFVCLHGCQCALSRHGHSSGCAARSSRSSVPLLMLVARAAQPVTALARRIVSLVTMVGPADCDSIHWSGSLWVNHKDLRSGWCEPRCCKACLRGWQFACPWHVVCPLLHVVYIQSTPQAYVALLRAAQANLCLLLGHMLCSMCAALRVTICVAGRSSCLQLACKVGSRVLLQTCSYCSVVMHCLYV